jgi:DNA-directed RNA polymerase specialized sigma subunit
MRAPPDLGRIDGPTAARLIALYLPIVRAVLRLYPQSTWDDLEAVGRVAILEGHLSHDPTKGANEATWVRKVIHWRLSADAIVQPVDCTLTGRAEPLGGHELDHNPELGYLKHQVLEALRELSPRHQTVVLARIEGETFDAIGQSLGISDQRAHTEYVAAVAHLRRLVNPDAPDVV